MGFSVIKLLFVTKNEGKVRELEALAANYDIVIEQVGYDYPEIQADTLEEVARKGAFHVSRLFARPLIVEDSGLFIERFGGFPGPYSAYVYKKIGNRGILKLMSRVRDRKATFKSVIAFCEPSMQPVLFTGSVEGTIAEKAKGKGGFGFDPIFMYNGRTFAEITTEMKNSISHRRAAFDGLIRWLLENKDVSAI